MQRTIVTLQSVRPFVCSGHPCIVSNRLKGIEI